MRPGSSDIAPLWTVLTEFDQRAGELSKDLPLLSVSKTHGVVRYADLFDGRIERTKSKSHYKIVNRGDIVLNKMSAATGAIGLAPEPGLVSPDYATFSVSIRAHETYLSYVLQNGHFLDKVSTILRGIGVGEVNNARTPRVSTSEYLHLAVYLPPLDTQRAIADYLDRETTEIDAMTADLDKMEALLIERRSTSIACSLHSSGGASAPIAAMAHVTLGKMVQPNPKSPSDIAAPYLRAAHVPAQGTLDLSVGAKQMWFSPAELGHLTVHAGDVVVVEGGAGYGRAAFVSADLDGWGFQNSIIRVRPREQVAVGKYIAYALQHAQSEGEIELFVSTATLPHFTAEKVERFRLPLPPLEEQRRIAAEIDRETAEIDAMLADITELRNLLAERRAALIAAAVTGQIDIPAAEETIHA